MITNTILFWALVPVAFGFWARTPIARVLTPRFITWFYRYLVAHTVVVFLAALLVAPAPATIVYSSALVANLYFVYYDYYNANKPDALPIGVKMDALGDLTREALLNLIWPSRRRVSVSSARDKQPQSTELQRADPTDVTRSLDLGLVGTNTVFKDDRGRLWAQGLLLKAGQNALVSKREFNEQAISTLRSDEQLQEAIERSQHRKFQPDAIRSRVRDEFETEDDERSIRRAERQERLARQESAAREAHGKREAAEAQIEFDRRRREARLAGEVAPSVTAEDRFRQRAEQIARYGSTGRFMPIAVEWRAKLIVERGGEEHLTEEDLNRIELIFAEARRLEESKS